MSWFIDSSVPLYALGEDGDLRDRCRAFLEDAARAGRTLHLSAEALQEILHHRMRRTTRERALTETRALAAAVVVHDFTWDVWAKATELVDGGDVRGRDAVHAATALLADFTQIVSTDRDFDRVPGLLRVDPGAR